MSRKIQLAGVFGASSFAIAMAIAPRILANPVAAELREAFDLLEGGDRVEVSFLGISTAEEYDRSLKVQWLVAGEWKKAEGSWTLAGTEDAEGGSGVMTYNSFERTVSCPAAGDQEIRLVFEDPDDPGDLYEWADTTIPCEAAGPTDTVAETETGCSVAGSPGAVGSTTGLLLLALGALFLVRRKAG